MIVPIHIINSFIHIILIVLVLCILCKDEIVHISFVDNPYPTGAIAHGILDYPQVGR